jgi:hypothetical protein
MCKTSGQARMQDGLGVPRIIFLCSMFWSAGHHEKRELGLLLHFVWSLAKTFLFHFRHNICLPALVDELGRGRKFRMFGYVQI